MVDTDRQQVVNAALGRDVDWDWLLAEASERSLKAISAAALGLPRPSEVSSQLIKVGRLLPSLQDAKALVPAPWDDDLKTSRTPNQLLFDRLGYIASAPDDSAEWHLALAAITDALAKSGDRSGVAFVGERAFERLLRWYEQLPDLEQFSAASLELGGQTLRLKRLGVPVRGGDVLGALEDFATQYLDHFGHSDDERQALALVEVRASRSLILAVADEHEAARLSARSAAGSLITMKAPDLDPSAWESALAACITALASIPDADPDEITRLSLYVGVGASSARLAGHLVSVGVDKARLLLEVNLAVDVLRNTSWVNSVEMLRTLDRNIIDDAARFEDDLRLAIVGEPPAG